MFISAMEENNVIMQVTSWDASIVHITALPVTITQTGRNVSRCKRSLLILRVI